MKGEAEADSWATPPIALSEGEANTEIGRHAVQISTI